MARTRILPTDPGAVKVWETDVAVETRNRSEFTKMTGTEAEQQVVVRKTALEEGPGDEVTMYLIGKIVGKPIEGEEKAEGRERKISHFTDKMLIDKHRVPVNVGDIMSQKRVPYNIAEMAKGRMADHAAEFHDEQCLMHLSGARGVGDEIQHYPVGYAGFPNAFITPDANHVQYFDGSKTKATLGANDKLSTLVIDQAILKAKKQLGDVESGKAVKMQKVVPSTEIPTSGNCFVFATGPEGMYDLRREVGDAGWLTLEKAKATAVGSKSPIFQGGDAFYNGTLIMEMERIVKFNDYGAGPTVNAMRSLFLGAHGLSVAYGVKGQKNKTRYQITDSTLDHGEEEVMILRMIAGYKKNRYNGQDFGVISVDHAYTLAAGATI